MNTAQWQLLATCNLGSCPSVYSGDGFDVLVQGYIPAGVAGDGVLIPESILREAAEKIRNGGHCVI